MVLRQATLSFSHGNAATRTPRVRGGKGAGLVEMVGLGLPVPPGFTIPTKVARALLEHGRFPGNFNWHLERSLAALQEESGRVFGSATDPLLVSVRSGAETSMPGMMDTVLNLGLNEVTVAGLAAQTTERCALDTWRRFLTQFGTTVLGFSPEIIAGVIYEGEVMAGLSESSEPTVDALRAICLNLHRRLEVPADPREQLMLAIRAVMLSWQNERAVAYRNSQNLPHWLGTAVTVQAMVFGNFGDDSGSGVVFSHDVTTGEPGLYGEFLPRSQGEDIVSGLRTPLRVSELATWNPAIYAELDHHVSLLSAHAGTMVDVEFTVESGRLYLLQYRRATRSPQAAATFAVQQAWSKRWSREQAVASLTKSEVEQLASTAFEPQALASAGNRLLATGLAASPGAVVGVVATTCELAKSLAAAGQSVVLVRPDTTPNDLPGMLVASAIVTALGGATCHAAVVARELNLPAVVGVRPWLVHDWSQLSDGDIVSVDGSSGRVYQGELPLVSATRTKEVNIFLRWHERSLTPPPRLEFKHTNEKLSANRLLNDFYLTDAMAREAKGTVLESRAAELRVTMHLEAATVLAEYLALAIAAESRHADFVESSTKLIRAISRLEKDGFKVSNSHRGRSGSQQRAQQYLTQADHSAQVRFGETLEGVFRDCLFDKGYGGPKWADIACTLKEFLNGTIGHSIFVDHVFDLRHNGGRLFDKHDMFSAVTQQTDDMVIPAQLEAKKSARSVPELRAYLAVYPLADYYGQRRPPYGFSAQVDQLFTEGTTRGLW